MMAETVFDTLVSVLSLAAADAIHELTYLVLYLVLHNLVAYRLVRDSITKTWVSLMKMPSDVSPNYLFLAIISSVIFPISMTISAAA